MVLFTIFFAVAKTVVRPADYFVALAVLHFADLGWFILVLGLGRDPDARRVRSVAFTFIVFDVITLVIFGLGVTLLRCDWSPQAIRAMTLIALSAITFVDWYILRSFYFASNLDWTGPTFRRS